MFEIIFFEEIEEIGFKYVDSGRVKEGLKLILRVV